MLHVLQGGLRPHAYCLPILKRERHRAAVLGAAVSGDSRFFLGTDSAPHPKGAKVLLLLRQQAAQSQHPASSLQRRWSNGRQRCKVCTEC